MVRVFISYARDSDAHTNDVHALAWFLQEHGVDSILDLWWEHSRHDRYAWSLREMVDADYIVVVASQEYRRVADGHGDPRQRREVRAEIAQLRELLATDERRWLPRILPVLLPGHHLDEVPSFLQPYSAACFTVASLTVSGAEDLLRVVLRQPAHLPPDTMPPPVLPMPQPPTLSPVAAVDALVIDDVLVELRPDQVLLDVRVRNAGARPANITRAAVRILTREEFLTAYAVTAHYDLLVAGDHNEVGVAHLVRPDEVDRFTLALGFADDELGCAFTADLVLSFNGGHSAVSKPFTFNSCFE